MHVANVNTELKLNKILGYFKIPAPKFTKAENFLFLFFN